MSARARKKSVNHRSRDWKRWWLPRIGLAIAAPILALALLEAALRAVGVGHPTQFLIETQVNGERRWVDNPHFGLSYFPAGMLRQPPAISIPVEKPAGATRIVVFGESAAMGDPHPAFCAGRFLEALLAERYPERRFEVISLAMTAINSHALLSMAREAKKLEADYWILLIGNNEMLGPYGAGTAFGKQAPPTWLVRASVAAKRTRVGQAIELAWRRYTGQAEGSTRWSGLELFSEQRVPEGSVERERVYANFRKNLRGIIRAGRAAGARVIVCSVPVNLRDCPPFGGPQGGRNAGLSLGSNRDQLLQEALRRLSAGDAVGADPFLAEAEKASPADALVMYLRGQAALAMTNTSAALEFLVRARDLDTVPIRTDSRLNQIGREAAMREGVSWADVAGAVAQASAGGIPGAREFYEHVHLTPEGNYAVARAFAEALAQELPDSFRASTSGSWADLETCARRLGLTAWSRADAAEVMLQRCAQPPFTAQLDHHLALRRLSALVGEWRARQTPEAAAAARESYAAALAKSPDDHLLRRVHAEFLEGIGDWEGAVGEWRKVAELIPRHFRGWRQAGVALTRLGRAAEAIPMLERVVELQPDWPTGHVDLARALFETRNAPAALKHCEEAIRLAPGYGAAYRVKADALASLGNREEALQCLEEAVRLSPLDLEARYILGVEYAVANRVEEARAQFREVVRHRPNHARALFNLAVAEARLQDFDDADAHFRRVLELDPGHKEARAMLERLQALPRKASAE